MREPAKKPNEDGLFNSPDSRHASYALTAIALGGAVYLVWQGRITDAAILSMLVVASVTFGVRETALPPFFTLLFTGAAALNAAGYVFDLWTTLVWFDELVHVVTPFVVVSAAAWLMIGRDVLEPRSNSAPYFAKVLLLGLLVGLAWEGFEYVAGMIGDRRDTLIDLAMDGIGAILAAAMCLYAARSAERASAP